MGIKYYEAPDVKQLVNTLVTKLMLTHINPAYVYCFRSRGTKSKRVIARIHSLERLWQKALKTRPRYLIEVIAERYDELSHANREKVLIHELLHIPKGFSGGFRPHKGYIDKNTINKLHRTFEHRQTLLKHSHSEKLKNPRSTLYVGCRPEGAGPTRSHSELGS